LILWNGDDLRARFSTTHATGADGLERLGFDLLPGEHPIIPVMLGEAQLAQDMAAALYDEGVYVAGFFFPSCPHGRARIRTQMNAALTRDDLDRALDAFEAAAAKNGSPAMTNEMRALVKAAPDRGPRMQTRPVPEIGPDDVLIRVRKTGICGTDIHIWQWDDWARARCPSRWSPATNSPARSWRSAATSRASASASAVPAKAT
jgi:hypothetical protein